MKIPAGLGATFRAGRRDEGRVIAPLDEERTSHDHQQHDADLDDHKDEIDLRGDLDPHTDKVWFAQLYGMSDNISFNLAKAGYRVAKYVPYGPVKSVMPYLLRRADENTSVAGQSSRELTMIKKELRRRRAVTR